MVLVLDSVTLAIFAVRKSGSLTRGCVQGFPL